MPRRDVATILVGTVAAAVMVSATGAVAAPSHVATPIPCGRSTGAPWTIVMKTPETRRHGNRYYVYATANLSCLTLSKRVAGLSRLTPAALRRFSLVIGGERLQCLPAPLPKEIKSVRPRTAWGWCGTDVTRVARLGFMAAAGTEFFWVTADKPRGY